MIIMKHIRYSRAYDSLCSISEIIFDMVRRRFYDYLEYTRLAYSKLRNYMIETKIFKKLGAGYGVFCIIFMVQQLKRSMHRCDSDLYPSALPLYILLSSRAVTSHAIT